MTRSSDSGEICEETSGRKIAATVTAVNPGSSSWQSVRISLTELLFSGQFRCRGSTVHCFLNRPENVQRVLQCGYPAGTLISSGCDTKASSSKVFSAFSTCSRTHFSFPGAFSLLDLHSRLLELVGTSISVDNSQVLAPCSTPSKLLKTEITLIGCSDVAV